MVSMARKKTHSPHAHSNVIHFLSDWQWVKQLKQALVEDQFCLYLKELTPLTTLDYRRYCEISLRLVTGTDQVIHPALFLPLAERYNLGDKIDQWLIKNWFEEFVKAPKKVQENYRFALKLSAVHLRDYRFFDYIHAQVNEFELSPDIICFEISERVALGHLRLASDLITDLQTQGYCCALDNCGSNMSSFSYLKYLPVDYLKISERFVRNIHQDIADKAIVELVNYIGQSMGLQVIAKGVDNEEIFQEIKALEIDYAEGSYLSQVQPMNLHRLP